MTAPAAESREYHVSPNGSDENDGSAEAPLETISAAADRAMPGNVVTTHQGTYREHVDPPRGGNSEDERIVYRAADGDRLLWYGDVDDSTTTLWARFGGADPGKGLVEVNVRPTVFYPTEPGCDYITVRGFTMRHAATQWAPPTTEQVGLLGTHWSTGWVIEDNVISHSRCTGITLGKYGESVDATGASDDRYNRTIRDALANGWERGSIGDHVVRNNTIYGCEQAGIVGSMGAVFSDITGNHIYDINAEGQFRGAEIAGIKFHGPIDTTISDNHVHHARRGIWLDWMAQGTRVTRNLVYETGRDDLFVEVSHGPFVVDNNVLLSEKALLIRSQGGAYVHNLIAGEVDQGPVPDRSTPFQEPHSTEIAGMSTVQGGDDRFLNNVFVGGGGLDGYEAERPSRMAGNVFLGGAEPSPHEEGSVDVDSTPGLALLEDRDRVSLRITVDPAWREAQSRPVTTELLGDAAVSDAPFTEPDGTSLRIDVDYFGAERDREDSLPGPFAKLEEGTHELALWPR